MKSDGDTAITILIVVLGILMFGIPGFLIGTIAGGNHCDHLVRCEAVAKKHAEFIAQPNGTTKFRWLNDLDARVTPAKEGE